MSTASAIPVWAGDLVARAAGWPLARGPAQPALWPALLLCVLWWRGEYRAALRARRS